MHEQYYELYRQGHRNQGGKWGSSPRAQKSKGAEPPTIQDQWQWYCNYGAHACYYTTVYIVRVMQRIATPPYYIIGHIHSNSC